MVSKPIPEFALTLEEVTAIGLACVGALTGARGAMPDGVTKAALAALVPRLGEWAAECFGSESAREQTLLFVADVADKR